MKYLFLYMSWAQLMLDENDKDPGSFLIIGVMDLEIIFSFLYYWALCNKISGLLQFLPIPERP